MKTVEQLRALVNNPNCKGFSRLLRQGETNQTETAYRTINGGALFTDFSKHPFGELPTTQGGKAAGAVQWLPTTWADLHRRYPIDCADFSPAAQEFGTVAKLEDRRALDDVLAGNIAEAVRKCRQEWTSLPGAAENSGRYTLDAALAVYRSYGGQLNEIPLPMPAQPPIVQPAQPTPAPAPPPAVAPAPKPKRQSVAFTDLSAEQMAQYSAEFKLEGATITVKTQPDGRYSLRADFP